MITKEIFEYYVGRPPENDDLERCNCPIVGGVGHQSCGWSKTSNLPRFMVGPMTPEGGDREVMYPANSEITIEHNGATSILGYLRYPRLKSCLMKLFTDMQDSNISTVPDIREHMLSLDVIKSVRSLPVEMPRELKFSITINREYTHAKDHA